jgi:DNA-binding protein YbaB
LAVIRDPAGLRWDDDLRAQLEELAGDYSERLAQLRQVQAQAARVTAVARSRDGLVSVMVGAQGQLLGVDLDPRAYERLSPQRLAAAVMEMAADAAADAADQVGQIMAPVLSAARAPDGDVAGAVPSGLSILGGGVAGQRW